MRSVVGVSGNPSVDDSTSASGLGHTVSEVDLSEFIIGHDNCEERETGDSEMGEGDLSCSEGFVEEGSVKEDGDKDGLEDESRVRVVVDHTLLGDRESSSLADHEIGPLYAHDGDEVTGLGESKSFSSVADLGSGDDRVLVEVETFTFVPSAARPGVGSSVDVEESDINTVVLVSVPVELGLEGLVQVVGVTVVKGSRVVDISGCGDVSVLKGESEGGAGAYSVIVEDVEIGKESSGSLDKTDLQVSERDKLGIHEMVSLGVTGVSFHDIKLGVLVGERDGGDHISSEINAEDEHGGEGEGDLEDNEENEGGDLRDVGGESVSDRFLQVIEDETTFFDTIDNGAEVIIEQNHITSVLSDLRSATHSNTDIGLLDSRGVIDTITSDGDDFSEVLASVDDQEFLRRSSSGEHNLWLSDPVHNLASLLNFGIIETFFLEVDGGELISVNDDGLAFFHGLLGAHSALVYEPVVLSLLISDDGDLGGNSSGGVLLITSNHNNLDTSGFAFLNGQIYTRARRIVQRDETNESKTVHGEPSLLLAESGVVFLSGHPGFPVFSAEVVGFLVNFGIEVESGETEDTLSHVTEESVSILNSNSVVFAEHNSLLVLENVRASDMDSIGSTLKEDGETILRSVGFTLTGGVSDGGVHVSDHEVELNVRGELDFVRVVISSSVLEDGAGLSVGFESFLGERFVVVKFLEHEGDNELEESGLGSISLNHLINPNLFRFSFLEISFNFSSFSSFLGSFLIPVLGLGEVFNLALHLLGHLTLDETGVGSELEERGGRESEGLYHQLEVGVLDVVLGSGDLLDLLGVTVASLDFVLEGLVIDLAINGLSRDEHVTEGHSVLGESTGLIGTDARGRSESLDGLKVLDEHLLLGHALSGEGKGDRNGTEETFRDVSHDNTDGEHQVSDVVISVSNTEEEESNTEDEGDGTDKLNEKLNFDGEGSLNSLGHHGESGDETNNGGISDLDDNTFTVTVSALSSEETNIIGFENVFFLVTKGLSVLHVYNTEEIIGLSSERGVVNFHFSGG